MSSKANYFKIGVVVLGGVAIALVALLLLGIGSSLRKPLLLETYLDQSVQGLEVGSGVKFRGVNIGTVHAIEFSRDRYEFGKEITQQRRYILIEVAVSEDAYRSHGRDAYVQFLRAEVARGLRFRLNAQGITGLSFLELDYVDPHRNPVLPTNWTPENPYIPSAPGTLTRLLTSVEQVFRKLEDADLMQIFTNLNQLILTTETEVRQAQIHRITDQATNLLAELRGSNQEFQKLIKDPQWRAIPATAVATLEEVRAKVERLNLDGTLQRLEKTLGSADAFLAGKEADLATTLANLKALSENLRAVSELVKSYPSTLIFGAPPKPVQPLTSP
ncbi:MAG: MCE family protein [Verrucomicrobiales bacterium]|nr:MCE family protein [Verrucomicrobiales bacterium]